MVGELTTRPTVGGGDTSQRCTEDSTGIVNSNWIGQGGQGGAGFEKVKLNHVFF